MTDAAARPASPDTAPRRIRVALGERSYDIFIGPGLIERAGEYVAAACPARQAAIVSDRTVAGLHLERLKAGLAPQVKVAGAVSVPGGESSKSFAHLQQVCEKLLELGIERGDLVIALGGGVVGDLGGFAASILRRGVRFVQVPTTLLAQVDSSVGGKTGINTPQGKNLIGTFYQPSVVLADTDTLATLPARQFRAGYAEVAKYGLLGDAAFFSWLERNWRDVFAGTSARDEAIEKSCLAKAGIVAEDEREQGRRALLNLGHTFGHALEAFAGYSDRLLHGEAISIGMVLAFQFSCELGLAKPEDRDRVVAHLETVGLPTRIAQMVNDKPRAADLLKLIAQDKKVSGGKLAFILARGIGDTYLDRDVPTDRLEDFLARACGER
ncbi:MAG: 3-dehydroquinate synthase [Hyphomicrobiales bacterium]